MENTFLESFNQGLNIAHAAASEKRLQQQAQLQQMAQMMQIQQMAKELQGEQAMAEMFKSQPKTGRIQTGVIGNVIQPDEHGLVDHPIDTRMPTYETKQVEGNKILAETMARKQNPEMFKTLISQGLLKQALQLKDRENPFEKGVNIGEGARFVYGEPDNLQTIEGKPKNEKMTLENLLAAKVANKEMTLSEAMAQKQQLENKTPNDFGTFYQGYKEQHPDATNADISAAWHTQKVKEQLNVGVTVAGARAEGFGNIRQLPAIDTKNNNNLVYANANNINSINRSEPGRFIPATQAERALNKTALIEDIRGNINMARNSLAKLKTNFTPGQRAAISYVLKSGDPKSASGAFMQGSIASSLSPDQMDYVTDIFQLHENAMAMRSVLGAGQGSDELRAAILATVPGGATPSKQWGGMQLNKFENVIDRLSRGVPGVPLKGNAPNSNQPPFDVKVYPAPTKGAKLTNKGLASAYLKAANGDRATARKLAREDGWGF